MSDSNDGVLRLAPQPSWPDTRDAAQKLADQIWDDDGDVQLRGYVRDLCDIISELIGTVRELEAELQRVRFGTDA